MTSSPPGGGDGSSAPADVVDLPPSRRAALGGIELLAEEIDPERDRGRRRIRDIVLAMRPAPGTRLAPPEPLRAGPVFWAAREQNDVLLAIRTQDFATPDAAAADAERLLDRRSRLDLMPVADAAGLQSFWLTLRGRVVLVGARAWHPTNRGSIEGALRRFIAMR